MEQQWNKLLNVKSDIESLKKTNNPNVIYSLTDEAEAIANACKENGISVTAFCDNEIVRNTKLICLIIDIKICFLGIYFSLINWYLFLRRIITQ